MVFCQTPLGPPPWEWRFGLFWSFFRWNLFSSFFLQKLWPCLFIGPRCLGSDLVVAHYAYSRNLSSGFIFLVWGFPNVFDGFPILGYDIWANSRLCFADLNTIEPREVEWQFSQSNSSSSCNRISYFLTLDLFQGMMQMDMACAIFMKMQWYEDLKINVPGCLTCKFTNTKSWRYA